MLRIDLPWSTQGSSIDPSAISVVVVIVKGIIQLFRRRTEGGIDAKTGEPEQGRQHGDRNRQRRGGAFHHISRQDRP